MYTLTKGRPKLVNRSLTRGYSQPLERLERRDLDSRREALSPVEMSAPKLVFNNRRKNYAMNPSNNRISQETITPQHEETVRFIAEAWSKVQHELEVCNRQGKEGPIIYQEKVAAPLRDFEPVDLDKWWSQRQMEKMNKS